MTLPGTDGLRRLAAALALAGLALAAAPAAVAGRQEAAGSQKKEDRESGRGRPSIKLRASVQAGFAPLSITFTTRLRDVATSDPAFCHAGVFLMRKLSSGEFATLAGEDPACLHDPEDHHVRLTYSHTYVVPRQGLYEFYAMVRTVGGREIFSNGVPVRVLASPAGE